MFNEQDLNYKAHAKKILSDMHKHSLGIDKISPILIGEPGTGKTTFVKFFSKLIGLPLVLIEVPHISEEHLINIPFLVINKEDSILNSELLDSDFKLVRAKSVLSTTLSKLTPHNSINHKFELKKDPLLLEIYEENKEKIEQIRKNFNSIMFFDEFYRARSVRITNILRTFLNGKIGLDDIPDGVYTIYASNMNNIEDQGLNEIPINHQFKSINFDTPKMKDWYKYIEQKHKEELDIQVIESFKRNITNDKIFEYDIESEVRISPRRLEEIVIYINELYKGKYDIVHAKEFIHTNTTNYINLKTTKKKEIFDTIIKELFEESNKKILWIDSLKNQIQIKEMIGPNRHYTPCLSGSPGVSKTSMVKQIGEELSMNVISIDCSPLNPEDTIGIPNVKGDNVEKQEVFFTEPLLYSIIMEGYNKHKGNKRYNHILLLDEINRTTPAVFNAIRKLILDKEINEDYRLPRDVIIVAALNPHGEGTNELTPHLKDVLDIIPAKPLFQRNIQYLDTFDFVKELKTQSGINGKDYVRNLFEKISLRFGAQDDNYGNELENPEERVFYWLTINNNVIYVSPREMTAISVNLLYGISEYIKEAKYDQFERYTPQEYKEHEQNLKSIMHGVLKENLGFILTKHSIEKKEAENTIKLYMNHLIKNEHEQFKLFENIYSEINIGLMKMLANIDFEINKIEKSTFIFNVNNYIQNTENKELIVNEFNEVLDYIINKKIYEKHSQLYEFYLDFFNIVKELDLSSNDNQLSDRISKVFMYNYKEITQNIKSNPDMYEIITEITDSGIFTRDKYKDLFLEEEVCFKIPKRVNKANLNRG